MDAKELTRITESANRDKEEIFYDNSKFLYQYVS